MPAVDQLQFTTPDSRIGNMTLEIREARRMVDEHPGEVIDVGADTRAPMKPRSTTEKDSPSTSRARAAAPSRAASR